MPSYDNINIFGSPLPESMRSGQPNFLSDTISNIPSSAYQLGSDVAQVVTNPVQTLDAIGNLGLGLIALAVPDAYQEKSLDKPQEAAMAVGQYISDRYGSVDKAQEALRTDPVGVLADVSGILLGGGYLATKAGLKAGQVATKAGIATDPLIIAGQGASTAISKAIPTTKGLPSLANVERFNELAGQGKVSAGDPSKTEMLVQPTSIDKNKIVDVRPNLNTKVNDPDLKSFKSQTIHDVKVKKDGTVSDAESGIGTGKALSYDPAVTVRSNGVGIELKVNQKARDQIASKERPKFPMAAVRGIYDDVDIFDPDLKLGMNPARQNVFTDEQGYAVKSVKDGKATMVDKGVSVKLNNPDKFKIVKGVDGEDVKIFDDLEYYTKDNLPKTENPSVAKILPEQAKGVTRRDVLKGAGAGLASLAVPMSMMTDVTKAIPPVAKSTGILAGIGKFSSIMDNLSPYLRGSRKREDIITGEVEDWQIATQPDINELYEARKFKEFDDVERATEIQFDKLETQKYPEIGFDNAFSQGARNPKIQSAIDRLHKKHDLVASEFSQINTRMMDDIFNSDLADQRVRTDKKAFESLQESRKQMGEDFTPTFDAQQSVNEIQFISRQLDNAPDKKVVELTSKESRDYYKSVVNWRRGTTADDVTQTITTGTVDGVPVYKIEHKYSVPKNPLPIPEEIYHVELYIPNEAGLAKLAKPKPNLAQGGSINEIDIFGEY